MLRMIARAAFGRIDTGGGIRCRLVPCFFIVMSDSIFGFDASIKKGAIRRPAKVPAWRRGTIIFAGLSAGRQAGSSNLARLSGRTGGGNSMPEVCSCWFVVFLLTAICKQPNSALLQADDSLCDADRACDAQADAMQCCARQAIPCAISSKPLF